MKNQRREILKRKSTQRERLLRTITEYILRTFSLTLCLIRHLIRDLKRKQQRFVAPKLHGSNGSKMKNDVVLQFFFSSSSSFRLRLPFPLFSVSNICEHWYSSSSEANHKSLFLQVKKNQTSKLKQTHFPSTTKLNTKLIQPQN